jgi:hypothetical protein
MSKKKKFKHVNKGKGIINIHDSEGKGYTLRPGESVSIDKISVGNGVVLDEENKDNKKEQGDDEK